jgi:glycerol kinase
MTFPTLVAVDAGTTGVTAILFDHELAVLHRAYREFPQSFPRPGWVEHEAGAILAALDATLLELSAHPRFPEAVALGITNQRETVFALDRRTGEALGPGIVWQDRRTEARCADLRKAGHADRIRALTGLPIDPYFSATKIAWRLAEDAGLTARAARGEVVFATVDTLVLAHLTGHARLATDPTNACRTMLYDIHRRRWDEGLCALFGVRPDLLPEVRESTADFGLTLPERTAGRALRVHGIAGDQQAALFGQSGQEPGSFKATYGTGSFLLLNTGTHVASAAGLVETLALGPGGQPVFALEGSVFVCGALVQWLRDQLGLIASASEIEALAASVPDSAGVTIVPAFVGLGAPYWDAQARGAILGLTRGTTRAHLARAALEAIALQNAELVELFRAASGLAIESLLADGGAASNDHLMQWQADLAGTLVRRPASVEATARGAAALAGVGVGLWDGDQPPAAPVEATFEPRLGASERAVRLAEWQAAVARVRTT